MHRLRRVFIRILTLFTNDRAEQDLEREIRAHLILLEDEFLRQGMSPEGARLAAKRAHGGVEQATQLHRNERSALWLSQTLQDIRYVLRQIGTYPGFAAVVILTLALGTGADTAIFSVVNTVLLRPLPYRDPDRLVWITERFALAFSPGAAFGPDYVAWQRENPAFEEIEAFQSGDPNTSLSGKGASVAVRATSVTPRFFTMLGVSPILGRSFTDVEGTEGRNQVALLSEGIWRTQFGGDPNILGKTIHLDGSAYILVGVLPGSVRYPEGDVWTPLSTASAMFMPNSRPMAIVNVIGRLREGVTISQAESDLQVVGHRIDSQYPVPFLQSRDRSVQIIALNAFLVRNVRSLLLILLGVVGFVLLIACANVSNLLLSRATGRGRGVRRPFSTRRRPSSTHPSVAYRKSGIGKSGQRFGTFRGPVVCPVPQAAYPGWHSFCSSTGSDDVWICGRHRDFCNFDLRPHSGSGCITHNRKRNPEIGRRAHGHRSRYAPPSEFPGDVRDCAFADPFDRSRPSHANLCSPCRYTVGFRSP